MLMLVMNTLQSPQKVPKYQFKYVIRIDYQNKMYHLLFVTESSDHALFLKVWKNPVFLVNIKKRKKTGMSLFVSFPSSHCLW